MMGSRDLIPNKEFWLAEHNWSVSDFNTLEQRLYKVRSDSAENKLYSVQFSFTIMYHLHKLTLSDINEFIEPMHRNKPNITY